MRTFNKIITTKFILHTILISVIIILGKGLYTFGNMYKTYFSGSEYQMYRWNDRDELPTLTEVLLAAFIDIKFISISLILSILFVGATTAFRGNK